MIIAIDLRPLMSGRISGVETYTTQLVSHLLANNQKLPPEKQHTYILWLNAAKSHRKLLEKISTRSNLSSNSQNSPPNIHTLQTRIPSKILNLTLSLFRYPKIDRLIAKKLKLHPDLMLVPDLRPTPVSPKTKKISVVHDLAFHHFPHFFSRKSRVWFKLINPRRELNESAHIIAVSNFTKKDLETTYQIPPQKISVIYEGVEDPELAEGATSFPVIQQKYHLPQKYFLFLSTLEPRKNLKNLLKAFEIFTKEDKENIHLVIAGREDPGIFATSPQTAKKHNIHYPGFIQEQDKPALYQNAAAFIYPSWMEGFGLAVLEAMHYGTPVIASNAGSLPEICGADSLNNGAAILINPARPPEIAAAMHQILKNRAHLSAKARQQAAKFSWEKCAQQTIQILERALKLEQFDEPKNLKK